MKAGLEPGRTVSFSITVTEEMRPAFDGQVVHHVLSTVSMIYFMEKAGRHVILPFLEEEEEGVGFAIDVKHVGPAVIGQEVLFQAVCTEVTEKRVVCEVTAETSRNRVGIGTFTQALFRKREMEQRLEELQNAIVQEKQGKTDHLR